MSEKQMRTSNVLFVLVLIVLIINLAVDLMVVSCQVV